jgi:hypothetical protein
MIGGRIRPCHQRRRCTYVGQRTHLPAVVSVLDNDAAERPSGSLPVRRLALEATHLVSPALSKHLKGAAAAAGDGGDTVDLGWSKVGREGKTSSSPQQQGAGTGSRSVGQGPDQLDPMVLLIRSTGSVRSLIYRPPYRVSLASPPLGVGVNRPAAARRRYVGLSHGRGSPHCPLMLGKKAEDTC